MRRRIDGARASQTCGKVKQFKRTVDPVSGADKPFGFGEYESPEGLLHALRLLNGLAVFNENLIVKVDSKTQAYLDRYAAAKRAYLASVGQEPTHEQEQIESNNVELHARRVVEEALDRRQHLVARMPKPGHADGRRATPGRRCLLVGRSLFCLSSCVVVSEPDEILSRDGVVAPDIASMSAAAVSAELTKLRATQEARGRKLSSLAPSTGGAASSSTTSSGGASASASRQGASSSASSSLAQSSSTSSSSSTTSRGAPNSVATSSNSIGAASNDVLVPESELQAQRDARERERVRELRAREQRRRDEHEQMLRDERAREQAERSMARRDEERVERLRREAAARAQGAPRKGEAVAFLRRLMTWHARAHAQRPTISRRCSVLAKTSAIGERCDVRRVARSW